MAAWSNAQEGDLTGAASARNDALSDNGRTAEVKGQIAAVVNTVFSYNYADVAKTEKAAQELLTGKAVQQYDQLFALVRQRAPRQKQVLTTAVTDAFAVDALYADGEWRSPPSTPSVPDRGRDGVGRRTAHPGRTCRARALRASWIRL
ncbi:hypothetical protein ACQEU6_37535 [Spirillospora sp. CA-108201]